jgi:hypothetical protein
VVHFPYLPDRKCLSVRCLPARCPGLRVWPGMCVARADAERTPALPWGDGMGAAMILLALLSERLRRSEATCSP